MARALHAWAINWWNKTWSLIYSTDRELNSAIKRYVLLLPGPDSCYYQQPRYFLAQSILHWTHSLHPPTASSDKFHHYWGSKCTLHQPKQGPTDSVIPNLTSSDLKWIHLTVNSKWMQIAHGKFLPKILNKSFLSCLIKVKNYAHN